MPELTPSSAWPRRAWLIAATATAAGLLASRPAQARTQGSGQLKQETRPLADIVAIAVAGPFELTVRQAAQPALSLSADDNVLPLIETEVQPGRHGPTLHIRLQRGADVSTRQPMRVAVDVVQLRALNSAGSGQVHLAGLKSPELRLSLAGSTAARLEGLAVDRLDLGIAGSGRMQAAGSAAQLKLSISGSGDADLKELSADDVRVRIAGSGDADVSAQKSLSISVAGSGRVTYGGAVGPVSSTVTGSGTVTRR